MVENLGNFKYVEEFPNPLDIYRKNENEYYEASITLKNITNNYLIQVGLIYRTFFGRFYASNPRSFIRFLISSSGVPLFSKKTAPFS